MNNSILNKPLEEQKDYLRIRGLEVVEDNDCCKLMQGNRVVIDFADSEDGNNLTECIKKSVEKAFNYSIEYEYSFLCYNKCGEIINELFGLFKDSVEAATVAQRCIDLATDGTEKIEVRLNGHTHYVVQIPEF